MADITERRRNELEIRALNQYLDAIIMHLPVGVAILEGEDLRYFRINQVLAALNGLPVEDHLGKTVAEVIPESAELVSNLLRVREEGRASSPRELTVRLPKKPDQDIHVINSNFPIVVDGEVKAIGAVVVDITARKESENQLRKAHDELKTTQAQLIQAGRLAALGELGAGIAHELNQPLAALQLFTETMRAEPDRRISEFSEELNLIAEQHLRMAKIVDNIRGFARQSPINIETISPADPLDDALMLFSERLRLAGVEVVRELGESLPQVRGDRAQLQQVFLNLLSNALQALGTMPDEAPKRIVLGLSSSPRGGDEAVEYTLEDTGPGIPEELVARIFEPFFTTKVTGEGTGLGLSLVHGIIAAHSGEIRYEPGAEGGARFIIRLPATTDGQRCEAAAATVEGSQTSGRPAEGGQTKRLLVVDDEKVLRSALAGLFRQGGWDVATAASGTEALAILAESRFDALLLDLKMPGMSGLEVCRRVAESWPAMAVVVMSGFVTEDEEQHLVEKLGVVEVVRKPAQPSVLEESLQRALEKSTVERSSSRPASVPSDLNPPRPG